MPATVPWQNGIVISFITNLTLLHSIPTIAGGCVRPLDLNAMRQAARHFLGEHDFSAFRSSRCVSPSPVKIINDILVSPIHSPFASLKIEVEANSFLQHMVRIIIGTLAAVGEKRLLADDIPRILEDKDRRKSGKTAPPYGLYAQKVYYDEREVRWPSQVIDL